MLIFTQRYNANVNIILQYTLVGDVLGSDPDELACRPPVELPPPSADFSLPDPDFLEPPPNSRLKKPGLLSPLLDMLGHVSHPNSTSGHVVKSEVRRTENRSSSSNSL